ncbi:MAG TPA: four-carbon acid sugar kinase family protein [Albitalea sp.]
MSLRLAFYGDDFTGSTDALEVLAFAGLRTALFLAPPTPDALAKFGTLDAIGVAGDSRAMTPGEMDERLPRVFDALAKVGAPLVHYKVCSTFDSAPSIGSIGRAIEIARLRFGAAPVPIVAATPALQRYCAFGHLFARSATDDQVHRIDRHPIMSVHPVTPMDESDLRVHLARQAPLSIASFAFPQLEKGRSAADEHLRALLATGADGVLFDGLSAAHLTEVGRLLERMGRDAPPRFVVGSSGVEYALTQWWREAGDVSATAPDHERFAPVDRVLAVSGSASLLSARQIDAAVQAGFAQLPVDAAGLLDERRWQAAAQELAGAAARLLREGRSVIAHTARGPKDPRIEDGIAALVAQGCARDHAGHEAGRLLGRRLGHVTAQILDRAPIRRLLLSGGDTSSQVTQALAPQALVIAARLSPGAPLCRMVSDRPSLDGVEVALKGGQMGDGDFFETARRGRP